MREMRPRVIPVLLLTHDRRLVKTVRYRDPLYVGDPLNAIKIFNEKGVDELAILNIDASRRGISPDLEYLKYLTSECFMPVAYGGGITSVREIEKLVGIGVEKVVIGTALGSRSSLLADAVTAVGTQSLVGSVDVRANWLGRYSCFVKNGTQSITEKPVEVARRLQDEGIGEILLNAIHRDGTMDGYDQSLIQLVAKSLSIPVIASGGAGCIAHFGDAIASGSSAVAAASLFLFKGPHRAVLINVPEEEELIAVFNSKR
jgi:imidazole glycerol-phosphate synthase subunit HisF